MAERAVGLARHAGEIGLRDAAADKGADHLDRDFRIRLAGKAGDRLGIERRATTPGTYRPPSRARPASITSTKSSAGASPRVDT